MTDISYHIFSPEKTAENMAAAALSELIATEESDVAWSRMIRHRLAGHAAAGCTDRYYIALDGSKCVSRLWCGWGKHADAIGNWGHFRTAEIMQGRGIGRRLLDCWFEHQQSSTDNPAAFLCSCAKPFLVELYGRYGFRLALKNTEVGPLYCPARQNIATRSIVCFILLCGSRENNSAYREWQVTKKLSCCWRVRRMPGSLNELQSATVIPSVGPLLRRGENAKFNCIPSIAAASCAEISTCRYKQNNFYTSK